jgi:carboxyl-terminal processing protease
MLPLALLALAACGGGGDGASNDSGNGDESSDWVPGQFLPAESFAAQCRFPRSGNDSSGEPYPDVQGAAVDENNWLRSWSNDLYLWYDEIIDRDPAAYADPLDYFALLKTTAITSSGRLRDRFHFTYPTEEWEALSQSGVTVGYGVTWSVLSTTPPREFYVAYTEPETPATGAGLARGQRVLTIDGVDVVNDNTQAGVDVINAALYPAGVGESHDFEMQRGSGAQATSFVATMTSQVVTSTPVQNVGTVMSPNQATVGYLLFNDHIATADLVIDIRYNGGGYLYIASELAYMVAGDVTAGRVFEGLEFNDKHPETNPVTGQALEPIPFYNGYRPDPEADAVALPTLSLPRVFMLTGPDTCSASESIINGLRGVGVEVIQVGAATCGKPYGFYPTDNCGTTYFSIQTRGVNDAGFGDYADGFTPSGSSAQSETSLPGCLVPDDYTRELGDPDEARLSVALYFRDMAACPAPPVLSDSRTSYLEAAETRGPGDGTVHKGPWLTNRIFGR